MSTWTVLVLGTVNTGMPLLYLHLARITWGRARKYILEGLIKESKEHRTGYAAWERFKKAKAWLGIGDTRF